MSERIIWSTNATRDYALGLSREEKINLLLDRGYDPEMINAADDDQLADAIENDDYMWQDDSEEFERSIAPMVAKQTLDGVVIMFGQGARWDGTRQLGRAVDAEELQGGDIDPDVTDIAIEDDGEGLVWRGTHHDGTHVMKLYAIPEDREQSDAFITTCFESYINDRVDFDDMTDEQAIEDAKDELFYNPEKFINEYCDFELVPDVCDRIHANVNESLEESTINEVKAKDPQSLRDEYIEIRDLSDEYGREYFTAMPFTAYDNDPESIEMKYPNFFKVVKAFFKEMGILDKEELNDSDALDDEWYMDISEHDWETLMKTCDLLTTKHKRTGKFEPYQFEKIYKDNFDDGLSDEKILADRENNESLEEETAEEPLEEKAGEVERVKFSKEEKAEMLKIFEENKKDKDAIKACLKMLARNPENADFFDGADRQKFLINNIKRELTDFQLERLPGKIKDTASKVGGKLKKVANKVLFDEDVNCEFNSDKEAINYWKDNKDSDPVLSDYVDEYGANAMEVWLRDSRENGYICDLDEDLNEAENSLVKMIVKPFSGLNSDGYDIEVSNGDEVVFSERYRFGDNASYKKEYAEEAKPYIGDIVNDLCTKYGLNKNDIEFVGGKNIFRGDSLTDDEVSDYRDLFLDDVTEDLDNDVEVEFECYDCGHTYKKKFGKDYFEDEEDLENVIEQSEDDCPECGGHARAVSREDLNESSLDYDPDEWEEDDIALHKSIDWKARNFEEYPVEGSEIDGVAKMYRRHGEPETKQVKFKKFIRPNSIFPPYYAAEEDPFEGSVGHMYDGEKHGKYGIHNRYEDQELYDLMSESAEADEFGPNAGPWGEF